MLQAVGDLLQALLGLGLDPAEIGPLQMALRTLVIYAASLALVRIGSSRFMSESTAFDLVVGIMLGSIMSRAINSSAPLVPTLAAGLTLVVVHRIFAALAYATDWFGQLIKGNPILLIKNGEVQRAGVRRESISARDLNEALRMQGQVTDPEQVALAYRERNGKISVIPKKSPPRVVVLPVEDGVQTVRIEWEE
ncbi:MAG TPA: YetF domain-containing protein [Anaerolineaceae bacterium]|nr:YetF domain-containing protein [Anaerolineaceae bacterium]